MLKKCTFHNLASLTTGLTFSPSAFPMIILDGIGEEVADDAPKSLAMQVDRRRATETESRRGTAPNHSQYSTTLPGPPLPSKNSLSLRAQPLADLLEIREDKVRRRLERGKCVHFLPIAEGVIDYIHTAPGRMVGTLAFSALRDCLVMRDGDAEHSDVKPGQVMHYDGDEPIKWQGKEEGFGLMMWCSKTTSFKAG
ncbi:hypothetical protein LTS02_017195 [Friedmanniomyces endolithicus]|nr:hypothetical protein LTS02_017195 [Friedmanniomyces endolithicus]